MNKLNHSDFEDTKTAFAYQSDSELKNTFLVFKAMSFPWLVNLGSHATLLALKMHLPIAPLLKNTIYKHFCGGNTLEEVSRVVEKLEKYNISVILNYGVRGKHSEEEFDKTADAMHRTLDYAIKNKNITTISCKPSGLIEHDLLEKVTANKSLTPAEETRYNRGVERLRKLLSRAHDNKVTVHLDAEETWIQGAIDDIALELSKEFNKDFPTVINGIQLYIKDKLDFLKYSLEHAKTHNYIAAVKLVRGAYMEKERARALEMGYPSPICDTLEDTHKNYNAGLKYCVENIDVFHLSNATHNEASCIYLAELMDKNGLPPSHPKILTSQLKGMSDNISFSMASKGYNIQKYIPYGPVKQVIPYLLRRAQENTSVEGQTTRELDLVTIEKKRRNI
ncbi:MAG: proline dehydrogenase family protein [Saprospiraceae bacterium]